MNKLNATIILLALTMNCLGMKAAEKDSTSLHPSFGVEYTGEVQTDFKRVRQANLLHLSAEIPLSKTLSFEMGSLSIHSFNKELVAEDLQGYSNINADDLPFALTVAGFNWQINDHHSVFAGIRRTDEDYFCSDGVALFTNSSCGIFPTLSFNFPIATFPEAAWGIHYKYDTEPLCLQASLYNGAGNHRFSGRNNVFRFCPQSDGIFAIGQAEYRYRDSHYYLGASLHTEPDVRPSVWTYAEQALAPHLTLLAAYGHTFGRDNVCNNFYGLGAKYGIKNTEFGLFTDYTNIDDIHEWATELICSHQFTNYLTVKPVLHILHTDGDTKCIGMLRFDITF